MRYVLVTTAAMLTLGMGGLPAPAASCPQEDLVQGWYHCYLGRAADPSGLQTWVQALRGGTPPAEVQASILASEEYYCRYGHTPEGFVAGLYRDVLGRGACAPEVQAWVGRLLPCGDRQRLARDFLCAAQTELAQRLTPGVAPNAALVLKAVPAIVPSRVPVPYAYEYGRYGPSDWSERYYSQRHSKHPHKGHKGEDD
jgi:hypothetical protein